jgi:hypothetical protein
MLGIKSIVMMMLTPMAVALLMGLAGCEVGVDGGPGPEWDGTVFVGGGYYDGHGGRRDDGHGGDGRDYHAQAFHAEGGHPAAAASARGNASRGTRSGGGGHASSGGGRK